MRTGHYGKACIHPLLVVEAPLALATPLHDWPTVACILRAGGTPALKADLHRASARNRTING
jgi:hypothetical protein